MRKKKRTFAPDSWQARLATSDPSLRVHLIGMGGAGLSAIAHVLLDLGMTVSGSDRDGSAMASELEGRGAHFLRGHSAAALLDLPPEHRPDVVLVSSAIDKANPERAAADSLGIDVVKRDDFLPVLLARRTVIAIAGAHGKSTTTSMVVKVLREAGIDCGYIIGTVLPGYGNGSAGGSPYFVIEADEYDRMFLGLSPIAAVITNVEWDHPDCYPTPASFRRAFVQFVDRVPREGMVISCLDDVGAEQVHTYGSSRGPNWITYGLDERADLRAVNVHAIAGGGSALDLLWWNAPSGSLTLRVPGLHNVRNALAALAVSHWCGIQFEVAAPSLESFGGAARRFEFKGDADGVLVYDDYAHHPTEIAATLAAARRRYPDRRIWAVFQPHTFSRTRHMLHRMGDSFEHADRVIVTDIYGARERDDGSVSAAEVVAASNHTNIVHIGSLADATAHLVEHLEAGDLLVTMGAGDCYRVGEMVLQRRGSTGPDSKPADAVPGEAGP